MNNFVLFVFLIIQINVTFAAPHTKPWEPEPKPDQWWNNFHQQFLSETKKNGDSIQIVFIGDSIIGEWDKDVWKMYYSTLNAVNYGIGGDHIQNILWRMDNGEIDEIHPKLVVINAGSSNLGGSDAGHPSDEDIAHGINQIVINSRMKLPNTKVLILGIIPRDDGSSNWAEKNIKNINSLLTHIHNGDTIEFLDLNQFFQQSNGSVIESLYQKDKVHLNKEGYTLLSQKFDSQLKRMINYTNPINSTHAKPWESDEKPDQWWHNRHNGNLAETKKNSDTIQIVFIGDMITDAWDKDVWQKHYLPLHAVNYGIGGDRTQHILWRIEWGEINGLNPKLVVLNAGSNNLGHDDPGKPSESDIAHGVIQIISAICSKLPHTKVLLLGITPREDWAINIIKFINSQLLKYDNGNSVRFLDVSSHFTQSNGSVIEKLYITDKVHFTKEGYELLAQLMDPLIKKMMSTESGDNKCAVNAFKYPNVTSSHPKPWEPEIRTDLSWWMPLHERFIEQTKKDGDMIQVVFYGDSITRGWVEIGKDVWEQHYVPLHAVDYAIGGDRTQHLVWRMTNGEIEGLHPKLVVLKIGTNNLWVDHDDEIVNGIKHIIEIINLKMPHSKILLLGILPRGDHPAFTPRIKYINSLISQLANGNSIQYLDMTSHFQDTNGHIIEKLYISDKLHLTKEGYEIWAQVMDPLLHKILN